MNQKPRMLKIYVVLLSLLMHLSCAFTQALEYYRDISPKSFRKEKLFNDTIDFMHFDNSRLNAAIFFAANEVRLKNHLNALEFSPELEKTAAMHSADMVDHNFFSHTNPFDRKKETPNDRARLMGIANPFMAENLARGFGLQYKSGVNVYVRGEGRFSYTPGGKLIPSRTYLSLADSFLENWMNSRDHRKNILATEALQMGCGVFFFFDKEFNSMPSIMATQNFQWYERIRLL
jgi:uncharacterized protein YkwD